MSWLNSFCCNKCVTRLHPNPRLERCSACWPMQSRGSWRFLCSYQFVWVGVATPIGCAWPWNARRNKVWPVQSLLQRPFVCVFFRDVRVSKSRHAETYFHRRRSQHCVRMYRWCEVASERMITYCAADQGLRSHSIRTVVTSKTESVRVRSVRTDACCCWLAGVVDAAARMDMSPVALTTRHAL